MKTREQIYGQEAAGILRDVSMYRALTEMQLLKLYPHKESKIRNLLSYLQKQGRIVQRGEYYRIPADAEESIDYGLSKAVWVLTDFMEQVEYHSVSDYPAKIIFFADGEVYEIIYAEPGKEQLINQMLSTVKEVPPKYIVLIEQPEQIAEIHTPNTSGYCKEDALSDPAGYGGDACINQGYADGWLNLPAMAAPDSRLCRYAIYESGFAAFDIALYSSQLYPEGEALSSQGNAFHAAVSFGLCEDTCAGTDIITRGEAADLLYALLTGEFTVAPPPILETIPLNNKEGVHLNSYLLELQKIPESIRQAFAERGWQYTIDYEYLARLSEERNMSCIGATNYGSRQITVSSAGATIHEFGHFLDELMGFPSQTEGFYQEESGTAAALLRPYALTNEREYFADCFVYWLTYRDNSKKMAALCSAAPKTYAYLLALESQNWQPAA